MIPASHTAADLNCGEAYALTCCVQEFDEVSGSSVVEDGAPYAANNTNGNNK
eukprot:CAMPEP_0180652174 /NCGR_PEP_ID=MMETSP1037_2-20121125/53332_1 /TAXON_ID=632150 /ORGANISM="Azadinium spinosum, Strain 3D9" /LENGTH=51 /DNA_ID=CAMNT_0022677981 /DNA_START=262 /DNA_END=417 /DNA_ORIENTATION=-